MLGKSTVRHILIFAFVTSLVGCFQVKQESDSQKTQAQAADDPLAPHNIMLLTKSQTNPYYVMMEQGARQAAKELGVTLIAKGTPNETHIAMQKKMIVSAKEEGIDAVVFVPSNPTQLLHSLKQVQDEAVVLVNLDDQIEAPKAEKVGLKAIPFVGIDNRAAARQLAEEVLKANPHIEKAFIVAGPDSSSVAAARSLGFRDALQKFDKQIVGEQPAEWQYVKAFELTSVILDKFPQIDAIFCANDVMALGVIQQLEEKRESHIKVIGYDAIPEAREMVSAGKMEATLDQQSYQQGYIGVKVAVALLNGEDVEQESWVSPDLILQNK